MKLRPPSIVALLRRHNNVPLHCYVTVLTLLRQGNLTHVTIWSNMWDTRTNDSVEKAVNVRMVTVRAEHWLTWTWYKNSCHGIMRALVLMKIIRKAAWVVPWHIIWNKYLVNQFKICASNLMTVHEMLFEKNVSEPFNLSQYSLIICYVTDTFKLKFSYLLSYLFEVIQVVN
jgi:hypothetical protein